MKRICLYMQRMRNTIQYPCFVWRLKGNPSISGIPRPVRTMATSWRMGSAAALAPWVIVCSAPRQILQRLHPSSASSLSAPVPPSARQDSTAPQGRRPRCVGAGGGPAQGALPAMGATTTEGSRLAGTNQGNPHAISRSLYVMCSMPHYGTRERFL